MLKFVSIKKFSCKAKTRRSLTTLPPSLCCTHPRAITVQSEQRSLEAHWEVRFPQQETERKPMWCQPQLVGSTVVVSAGPQLCTALLQARFKKAACGLQQHPCDVTGGQTAKQKEKQLSLQQSQINRRFLLAHNYEKQRNLDDSTGHLCAITWSMSINHSGKL